MLLGRGLLAISSLVLARVSTMLLTPAEIGRYNILQTITFLLSLILITPISMYFNRKIVEWNQEGRLMSYLKYYALLILPFGIAGAVLVMIYNHFFKIGIEINSTVLFVFVLLVPFISGIQNALTTALNYLEQRMTYVFLTNFANWGGLILASLLAISFTPVGEIWLVGQQVVLIGVCIVGYVYFKKIVKPAREKASFKQHYATDPSLAISEVVRYSLPYAGSMVLYWLQTYCYQLILNYHSSTEQVGLFTTGIKIGQTPLAILDAVLFQYFISFYFKDIANADSGKKALAWNKFAGKILPLVFPTVMAVMVAADPLTIVLVDKSFFGSKNFVMWGAATEGLRIFSTVISQVAIAEMKINAIFLASFIPAAVTLGVQLLFITYNPALFSGLALFLGMLSNVLVGMYVAKRLLPVSFPWKEIFKNILLSSSLIPLFIYRKEAMNWLFIVIGNEGWKHFLSPLVFLSVVGCLMLPLVLTLKIKGNE